jgi:hypothetical protein
MAHSLAGVVQKAALASGPGGISLCRHASSRHQLAVTLVVREEKYARTRVFRAPFALTLVARKANAVPIFVYIVRIRPVASRWERYVL